MSRIAIVSNIDIFHERSRVELVERLSALGHDVMVIAPVDPVHAAKAAWPCRWWNWPLVQHGVHPIGELAATRFLVRLFREERPDIVLNFRLKAALYGTAAARLAGVASVNTIFTGLGHYFVDEKRVNSPFGKLIRMALQPLLGLNETVFFQNPDDLAVFERLGLIRPDQGFLVPGSGVNVTEFSPLPKANGDDRFVLIARMLRDKGIIEFCEAARQLRASHPAARFVLVGGAGSEPTALQPAGLAPWTRDGTVEYRGQIADVRPEIAAATAVVLPSYYAEGVPRSLLEALAMGRPLITTDMPGCRMTVEEGVNGFLVKPRDVASLAGAMEKLIGQPEAALRMGSQSRRMAVEKFDVHIVVERLTGRLLAGGHGPHSADCSATGKSSGTSTAVDAVR